MNGNEWILEKKENQMKSFTLLSNSRYFEPYGFMRFTDMRQSVFHRIWLEYFEEELKRIHFVLFCYMYFYFYCHLKSSNTTFDEKHNEQHQHMYGHKGLHFETIYSSILYMFIKIWFSNWIKHVIGKRSENDRIQLIRILIYLCV